VIPSIPSVFSPSLFNKKRIEKGEERERESKGNYRHLRHYRQVLDITAQIFLDYRRNIDGFATEKMYLKNDDLEVRLQCKISHLLSNSYSGAAIARNKGKNLYFQTLKSNRISGTLRKRGHGGLRFFTILHTHPLGQEYRFGAKVCGCRRGSEDADWWY